MYSASKLNKQGNKIQPWGTPFPIWGQSAVPCSVLTVASCCHTHHMGNVRIGTRRKYFPAKNGRGWEAHSITGSQKAFSPLGQHKASLFWERGECLDSVLRGKFCCALFYKAIDSIIRDDPCLLFAWPYLNMNQHVSCQYKEFIFLCVCLFVYLTLNKEFLVKIVKI